MGGLLYSILDTRDPHQEVIDHLKKEKENIIFGVWCHVHLFVKEPNYIDAWRFQSAMSATWQHDTHRQHE